MRSDHWIVHALSLILYTGALVGWALFAGKDVNWDQLSYHLYAPFNLLTDRLEHDFMGAASQGYLNAVGFLPFYWMVMAGLSSKIIVTLLSLIHVVNLYLLHGLAWTLFEGHRDRWLKTLGSVLIGASAPIFLMEVGSSFNDVVGSIPVLAMVWALFCASRAPEGGNAALAIAGLMAGFACGLKLSGLLFAFAATLVVLLIVVRKFAWGGLMRFGLCGIAGFVLVHGWWGYRLWQVHGNPVFPMMNNWFGSPDFSIGSVKHLRFVPSGIQEWLRFPFDMIRSDVFRYVEMALPDVRLLLALSLGAALIISTRLPSFRVNPGVGTGEGISLRPINASGVLVAFVTSCALLWMQLSGNGRYALSLLLLLGPLIVLFLSHLPVRRDWQILTAVLILVVQGILFAVPHNYRFGPAAHSNRWFTLDVPDELKQKPFIYLSIQSQSYSFIAPFVHAGSRFSNVGGLLVPSPGKPGGDRLQALLALPLDRMALVSIKDADADYRPLLGNFESGRAYLARLGLDVDTGHCLPLIVDDSPYEVQVSGESDALTDPRLRGAKVVACPVIAGRRPDPPSAAIEAFFDEVERRCPALLSPSGATTIGSASAPPSWARWYNNSDAGLAVRNGEVMFLRWPSTEWRRIGSIGKPIETDRMPCMSPLPS